MVRRALVVVICLVACRGSEPASGSGSLVGSGSGVTVEAPSVARSPDALWDAYRAAHVGATPANAVDTGRKLLPLLSADARQFMHEVARTQLRELGSRITVDEDELVLKLLGETAAARASMITAATPKIELAADRATITVAPDLVLQATRAGDRWVVARSPNLMASDTEVFRTPAGKEQAAGAPTADALLMRWRSVLEGGSGWDAYNLLSPPMRSRLGALMGRMGGTGPTDVARVLEKTLVDRRNRGIHVASARVEGATADRAEVVVEFSNGRTDRFTAIVVDGVWWLEFPGY